MKNRIKVLYFVDRMLRGGIQSLIIDWISRFDKSKIQVDFLLLDDGKKYELEYTLEKFGCNIYKLNNVWINGIKDFIIYKKALEDFFRKHNDYEVVHMHSSSKNFMVLKYAKKYGIPIRIAHSHNIDFQTKNKFKKVIGDIFKIPLKYYATNYLACSQLAGEWLFGKKITKSDKFKVIHNSIDYNKFKFDKNKRNEIRNILNISDNCLVIGHVGRFVTQKNHEFLIDIFNELHKRNSNFKLLLIGTGEKENIIKEKVKRLNLDESVIFAGFHENVNEYMNVMDVFVFPSLYEGLGIVLIEAQCNGLHCFASEDVIPLEAKITDLLEFVKLNNNSTEWAEKIIQCNKSRSNGCEIFENKEYNINSVINHLEKIYTSDVIKND